MTNRIAGMFVVAAITLVVSSMVPYTASGQDRRSSHDPAADRSPQSQSPYLQAPPLNLPPIKRPREREPKLPIDSLATSVYEVGPRRSYQIPNLNPIAPQAPNARARTTPADRGVRLPSDGNNSNVSPESVIGADGRVQITNTADYPWRTIVYIVVNFPSGTGTCTGEMIDAFNIYTAGHCVHDGTSWANWMQVFPGRSGSSTPLNFAWATYFRTYTDWTVNQDHRHDWSVVTLDRRIGNFTGWMGRITAGSGDGIYTGVANNAGYPDLAPDGTSGNARMYFDADNGRTADENNHWYYNDTRPGNSGSPVWYFDGTNRYIMTIHAYGDDGSGSNHGTRLNNEKFDRTNTWLAAPPTTPVDRPDLVDDGVAFMYGTPTTVVHGETTLFAGSDVRNIGTLAASGHWNRYVLSSNTSITTSDFTICEAFVTTVAPFNWADSDCSAVVPASIPPGLYWLGVIYDVYGAQTEFDEANNTAYQTGFQINVKTKYTLTVAKAGTGGGTVTSAPAGINCGTDCNESYLQDTSVTLTAAAANGSTFAGWSGEGCSGTGTCVVSMTQARNVTATFNLVQFTLTVAKNGTGAGTVTSNPAGINCGATCSAQYNQSASVTLTAAAGGGSTFAGWSGEGCSGTGTCVVSMTQARNVTATFNLVVTQFTLTVNKGGTGSGAVTSNPAGINCGATCSAPFNQGTVVILTATPDAGSIFAGWRGSGCSTGTCSVTMSQARNVTATFRRDRRP